MIFLPHKQNGFSLVETLVAISILLIVIVGPMTISMQSAKSSSFASEQVQAFFLAQEGLELAQKARDDLLLDSNLFGGSTPNPWGLFTDENGNYEYCFEVTGCGLSWDSDDPAQLDEVVDCTNPNDCKLYLNDGASAVERAHFSHDDGGGADTETIFTRRIYFTPEGSDAVAIRSLVTWRTGSLVEEQKVEVDTYLYNVYDTP